MKSLSDQMVSRRALLSAAGLAALLPLGAALAGCSSGNAGAAADGADADAAPGSAGSTAASEAGSAPAETASAAADLGNVLVAYYSAQGHTAAVAQVIADTLGADLFEITPTEPYANEDLNYGNPDSRVSREHEDVSLQDIALTQVAPDGFADYDTVFVGYPIWWGLAAWPTNGFVTGNDFTGKTVIPFCTSASSGLGQSGDNLAAMAGAGDWQEGRRFRSGAPEDDITEWLAAL